MRVIAGVPVGRTCRKMAIRTSVFDTFSTVCGGGSVGQAGAFG